MSRKSNHPDPDETPTAPARVVKPRLTLPSVPPTVPPQLDSGLEFMLLLDMIAAGIPTPTFRFYFAKPRRYRSDFAWPAERVLVEVEGGITPYYDRNTGKLRDRGRHLTISGFAEDCRKYNLAAMQGWRVLRFTPSMIEAGEAVPVIKQALGLTKEAA